jgi:HEPN domain-containing protein
MTKNSIRKGIILAKELTDIALGDFETAKLLFSVGKFRWGLIALQQSLEKAIKAILLSVCIIETEEDIKEISHQATTRTFKTLIEFLKNVENAFENLKNMLHRRLGTTLTPLEILQRGIENERVEFSQLFRKVEEVAEKVAEKAFTPVTSEDREKYEKMLIEIESYINKINDIDNMNIYEILDAWPPGAKTAVAPLISLFRPGGPYEELIRILAALSTWHIVFDYTLSSLRYRMLHLDENTYIVWWGHYAIQTIGRWKLIPKLHEIVAQLDENICCLIRLLTLISQCIDTLAKMIDCVNTAHLEIQTLLRGCQNPATVARQDTPSHGDVA